MRHLLSIAACLLLLSSASCSPLVDAFSLPTHVPTIALPTDEPVTAPLAATKPAVTEPTPTETPAPPGAPAVPVWAVNPVDQTILKIDPQSNSIVITIQVDGAPDRVAAGESGVWALDRTNNRLFHINHETGQLLHTIQLPPGRAEALELGDGVVWVGMTGMVSIAEHRPGQSGEVIPPSAVLMIDPASGEIVDQFAVQPVRQLEAAGSKLWILSRGVIDTPLQLIDPISREGWAVPLRNAPEWLPADAIAVSADSLWLLSTAYGKIFHATTSGEITAAVNLEAKMPTGYPDLLLAGGGLWAATPWGTVLHIDPASNRVLGRVELGIPLSQLIDGQDSIWVLSMQTGQIFRISLQHHEVIAQIATGSQLEPTVVPSPTPRIVVWNPCPNSPTSRLKVGDTAYVSKEPLISNRVRLEPNREAEILGLAHPGRALKIIEGPTCAEGWVWWKIKAGELEGWTAEGDQERYWLVPLYQ
jgi:hypothetical protein